MAGPGKPGPPARGIERLQHEENMSLAVEVYVGGATYGAIAEAVGWADRSVAKRAIDRAIAERRIEARRRAWSRGDALVEETRVATLTALRLHETNGSPAPPTLLTAAAHVSANYDRHYGLSPDLFIQVTHSDDVKVTHTDRLVQRMQRLMTGMDAINLDGVGSGRSPEEQVAALEAAGEVIDAEEVEDDQVDEDGRTDEDAGRWYHGKWIPAEADVDAPGLSGHSGLSRTSSGWPTTSSAA